MVNTRLSQTLNQLIKLAKLLLGESLGLLAVFEAVSNIGLDRSVLLVGNWELILASKTSVIGLQHHLLGWLLLSQSSLREQKLSIGVAVTTWLSLDCSLGPLTGLSKRGHRVVQNVLPRFVHCLE